MTHVEQLRHANGLVKWAEDNSRVDWLLGYPTAVSAALGQGVVNSGYARAARPFVSPRNAADRAHFRKLYDALKQRTDSSVSDSLPPKQKYKARANKGVFGKMLHSPRAFMASMNPVLKSVTAPNKNPWFLAHELGHTKQKTPMHVANIGGKSVGGLGTLLSMFSNDENFGRGAANVGTAGLLGTLASEVDASWKGSKLLQQVGVKGLGRFKAFAGVPTYAIGALMPQVAFQAKKRLGGYDRAGQPDLKLGK